MSTPNLPEDVLDEIRFLIWSGFKNNEDILDDLFEMYEDDEDLDEELVVAAVTDEFRLKCEAEKSWSQDAEGDLIAELFDGLIESGLLAVENVGLNVGEALKDITAAYTALPDEDRSQVRGYCLYSVDDLQTALDGNGLRVSFGCFDGNAERAQELGELICSEAESLGLSAEWNREPSSPVEFPTLVWRRPSSMWGASRLHQQLTYLFGQRDIRNQNYWAEFTHPQRAKGWIRVSPKTIRAAYPFPDDPAAKLEQLKLTAPACVLYESFEPNKHVTFAFPQDGYPISEVADFIADYLQRVWNVSEPMSELEWDDSDE